MKTFFLKFFCLSAISILLIHLSCSEIGEPIFGQNSRKFIVDSRKPILAQLKEVANWNSDTIKEYKDKITSAGKFSEKHEVSFTGAELETLEKTTIKNLAEANSKFFQNIEAFLAFKADHTKEENLANPLSSSQENLETIICQQLALPSLGQLDKEFNSSDDSIKSLLLKRDSFQKDFLPHLAKHTQIIDDELHKLKGIPTKAQEEERKRKEVNFQRKLDLIEKDFAKPNALNENLPDTYKITQEKNKALDSIKEATEAVSNFNELSKSSKVEEIISQAEKEAQDYLNAVERAYAKMKRQEEKAEAARKIKEAQDKAAEMERRIQEEKAESEERIKKLEKEAKEAQEAEKLRQEEETEEIYQKHFLDWYKEKIDKIKKLIYNCFKNCSYLSQFKFTDHTEECTRKDIIYQSTYLIERWNSFLNLLTDYSISVEDKSFVFQKLNKIEEYWLERNNTLAIYSPEKIIFDKVKFSNEFNVNMLDKQLELEYLTFCHFMKETKEFFNEDLFFNSSFERYKTKSNFKVLNPNLSEFFYDDLSSFIDF